MKENGEEKIIKPENYVRLLGINIEQNLSWNSHLIKGEKALLPALRQQLGSLKHISGQIPFKSRRALANGLLLSRIQYAITVWGGTYTTNLSKMQALLNNAARWVLDGNRSMKTKILMERCNWLSIREMIKMSTLVSLWKVIWLNILLQIRNKLELKDDFKIESKKPRLQTCQMGFLWRANEHWNSLPLGIRSMVDLLKFKKKLRTFIISEREKEAVSQTTGSYSDQISPMTGPARMERTNLSAETVQTTGNLGAQTSLTIGPVRISQITEGQNAQISLTAGPSKMQRTNLTERYCTYYRKSEHPNLPDNWTSKNESNHCKSVHSILPDNWTSKNGKRKLDRKSHKDFWKPE